MSYRYKYGGCPESIQPFWISRERAAWHWCNLAASQRRPYCASENSHSPVGASQLAVRSRWLSLCTVWPSHLQWPSEQISFITTMRLPILQLSCRIFFWQSIISLRSVSPLTAQICLPATSGCLPVASIKLSHLHTYTGLCVYVCGCTIFMYYCCYVYVLSQVNL
jgi:hypothetical protein